MENKPVHHSKRSRVVHWRWEYRLRSRPHVLLVANDESTNQLRFLLQARWLCSVAKSLDLALTLASILLPSRILIDVSLHNGTLLIERLKRNPDTHRLPIVWLARDELNRARGCEAGAHLGLVTPTAEFDFDIQPVQFALMDVHPARSTVHPLST